MPTSIKLTQDSDLPIVRFTNTQDLFDVIDSTTGDFLTVISMTLSSSFYTYTNYSDVSSSQFTEIERERDTGRNTGRETGQKKRFRKFRFRRYSTNSQILIITIPTHLHEALHLGLYGRFLRSTTEEKWNDIGSATHRAKQGHPGGGSSEGDSTGGPIPERDDKGAWPTLVIESGHSESLSELRNDMRWWFSMSDHQVKIVLLAKYDDARSVIILEKWEEDAQTRPGATTTRRFAISQVLVPTLRQSITITQNTTTNPVSYNVTSGALILSFRLLFLREPGLGEADFVFSVQDLERYAAHVWRQV